MSYTVAGYIESASDRQGWPWSCEDEIDLFSLPGDAVADLLFGLCKDPNGRALFADRSIPGDASINVRRAVARMDEHGGGIGYTQATLAELNAVDWQQHGVDLAASEWTRVFHRAERVRRRLGCGPEQIRVVVWGVW